MQGEDFPQSRLPPGTPGTVPPVPERPGEQGDLTERDLSYPLTQQAEPR